MTVRQLAEWIVPAYYRVRRWGDCLCLKDSNKDEKQIFNDGYGKGYRAAMTNVNLVVKGTENGFDLNEVAKTAYEIARKRAESGKIESPNDTLGMLKHCAGEVVEAMDAYNYFFYSEDLDNGLGKLASEFADIIICCLISCAYHGIDIEEAIEEAIKKNLKRAEGIGDKK